MLSKMLNVLCFVCCDDLLNYADLVLNSSFKLECGA